MTEESIFQQAERCLYCDDPLQKCRITDALVRALNAGRVSFEASGTPRAVAEPGRPAKPRLVAPRELARRRPGTIEGRAALLHSIAHIEFNAINLAWDAVYRFREMPRDFYTDWARVAGEEALHFRLLCERMQDFGYAYGDFDAHNGLWESACDTAHDPLVRMALVPRVLEARGLDVTPGIMQRLQESGDHASVAVLEIILRDEIGHVEIGTRWFRYLCTQRGLDAERTFIDLLDRYMKGRVRGPFHSEARRQAGFNEREMADLERLAKRG
jgi:uncharacterized ferritin-like protein (DUF455 family)